MKRNKINYKIINEDINSGIGAIPDAILASLVNHKDLGIHTEMLSDGVLKLIDCNAITNSKKTIYPGKVSCLLHLFLSFE